MIGLPVQALAATWWTVRTVSGACSSAACVIAHSSACCESAEPSALTTIPGIALPAPSARAVLGGQPLLVQRREAASAFGPNSLHAVNHPVHAPPMRA